MFSVPTPFEPRTTRELIEEFRRLRVEAGLLREDTQESQHPCDRKREPVIRPARRPLNVAT